MEQSPPWEANRRSASEDARRYMEPEGPLPCSQEPAIDPILSQMNQVHILKLFI
jgi:hypothetical protein